MDTDELRQLIVQKRELLARETFSRRAFNRCENMSDEMKDRVCGIPDRASGERGTG